MDPARTPTPLRDRVVAAFRERHGRAPELLVRAPGRVNLIGEHTDYNDGFVLPAAIDRELWIALRPRNDRRVVLESLDRGPGGFDLDGVAGAARDLGGGGPSDAAPNGTAGRAPGSAEDGWIEYLKGVAWVLAREGRPLTGWEGVLASQVPIGAGLSSSAALEMAALRAFAALSGGSWDARAAALLGQQVENRWMGVQSGIMDQLAVGLGREDHALLIDCRSLETTPTPLPAGVTLVILDTGTRRGLVGSAYNERREQCEAAARACGVPALRDAGLALLDAAPGLDETTRRRARHVITENARTLEAARALAAGELEAVGALMDGSHASLRDDFQVSTEALDTIVSLAREEEGCVGARMTGAGFGGCAVALVREEGAPAFARRVAERYRAALGLEPEVYVCRAAAGASVEG